MSEERAQEEMAQYLDRCRTPQGEIRLLGSFINPEEGGLTQLFEGANQLEFSEPPTGIVREPVRIIEYRPLRTGEAPPLF